MLQAFLAVALILMIAVAFRTLSGEDPLYAELARPTGQSRTATIKQILVRDVLAPERSGHPTMARAQMGADAIISGVKIVAVALVGAIIVAYLYDELASLQVLTDTGLNSSIEQLIVFFGLGILFAGILILVLVSRRVLSGIDRF